MTLFRPFSILCLLILATTSQLDAQQTFLSHQKNFWNGSIAVSGDTIYLARRGQLYQGNLRTPGLPLILISSSGWRGKIAISGPYLYMLQPGRSYGNVHSGGTYGSIYRCRLNNRNPYNMRLERIASSPYFTGGSFVVNNDMVYFNYQNGLYQGQLRTDLRSLTNVSCINTFWGNSVLYCGRYFYQQTPTQVIRWTPQNSTLGGRYIMNPNPLQNIYGDCFCIANGRLYVGNQYGLCYVGLPIGYTPPIQNNPPHHHPDHNQYGKSKLVIHGWNERMSRHSSARIEVSATVYGHRNRTLGFYAIYRDGYESELSSQQCSHGQTISFSAKFSRREVSKFVLRLYGRKGRLLAEEQYKVKKRHGGHGHQEPHHTNGRIQIMGWDIGGGNLFNPKAKISLKVYGKNAQSCRLYAIYPDGYTTEIDSRSCYDGANIYFNTRYDGGVSRFRVVLYDNLGRVLAQEQR